MTRRRPSRSETSVRRFGVLSAAMLTLGLAACSAGQEPQAATGSASSVSASSDGATSAATDPVPADGEGAAVYAHTGPNDVSAVASTAKHLVYVPDQVAGWVEVIDPRTYRVIRRTKVARSPEHVVPSWDLKTLWVNSDLGNTLTPIDPRTGIAGKPVSIEDPYNLYFTPDGSAAIVMAERLRRIDIRDPHTMALRRSIPVPCQGVNHADFTADLKHFVASCEFGGKLLVIDGGATKVEKVIDLNAVKTPAATTPEMARSMGGPKRGLAAGASAMPQDVRLTPDGRYLLAADMLRNGLWVIDTSTFAVDRFIPTGEGAHGIYPSRDAQRLFISNRDAGTVSVLDASTLKQVALWRLPGKASPDMGGVTADGRELWLSGRFSSVVYVIDTTTGRTTHVIPTKASPHGLAVWPQPGRFSLGHTGNMR